MYCVRKVTEDLYWVGANDHRLTLFENIHPIPQGVSYNAYLLLGQQTVLFDTIDWSCCRQLLENVSFMLKDRPLDVLVVTHLEPDHAASMEEILLRWRQVKIVASAKAFAMMRQFGFDLTGHETVEVKEGSQLELGGHTVQFLAAPMVHWPEVVVALDTTDGVLFSADAFGSFKALDGKLFQDEVNFDRDWLAEARRYYTNIVGKYGQPVQTLLKKASGVMGMVRYICPLHGLIWREDYAELLDKYQRWSTYTPEDQAVMIAYASMYGNTESAAQALAAKLTERGVETVVYDVSNTHVSTLIAETFRCSHLVLACATYNMGIYPVMQNFLEEMKALNVQKRTVALMENGTWASRAGDLMKKFLCEELQDMTVLENRIRMTSTMKAEQNAELDSLADVLAADIKKD